MTTAQKTKVEDGKLYVWDQDPYVFPEGIWMPVCRECRRGPLDNNQRWCGDLDNIRPGFCIKDSHPEVQ